MVTVTNRQAPDDLPEPPRVSVRAVRGVAVPYWPACLTRESQNNASRSHLGTERTLFTQSTPVTSTPVPDEAVKTIQGGARLAVWRLITAFTKKNRGFMG